MRAVVTTMLVFLAFCAGCGPMVGSMGTVNHTEFFSTHDARTHLNSVAKTKGYEVGGGGSGHSLGGPTGEKDFQIAIKGDPSIRDTLMRDYKDYVESELEKSGATISGRGVSGEVSGFDFNYHRAGLTGIIRVNSVIDSNGYIQVDVFIYEHK